MGKIVKNFFIDRLIYIVFMMMNSLFLTIFYILTVGEKVEIIYPFIISMFLIVCLLVIDWCRYIGFNRNILYIHKEKNAIIKASTREQKEVVNVIKSINLKHAEKEQNILSDYENKIYFLSGAIHKFKNYISVIGLIIDRNKDKSDDMDVILKDIEIENNNLYLSLDQVLNYIKLDSFANDFEPVSVNIFDEVKTIINVNRNNFINSNIFPSIHCLENQCSVITDRKWNKFIIEQIIINAIKYSSLKDESGNIYFNIYTEGKCTVLSIKDEGIGIPSYDLKKVFEPFFTGENGRKIRNSTGIGLYIVKEVTAKLGHEITIDSKLNVGTEVKIKYLSKI